MIKIVKKIVFMILGIVLIAFLILGYARYIEPEMLRVRSFDIKTQKDITPLKVVYFTDTHFGKYYDIAHIEKIVKKINQAEADLVIFGGDLLDNYARDRESMDLDFLQENMKQINASLGKYAVWGNHDYGGGSVRIYKEFMTSCGFEVLDDESIVLEGYGIKLIGYDDYLMGRTEPELYTLESSLFNLIVAHEPIVSQFIESKSENFLLAGHTHGGQVAIPNFTEKILPQGSGKFVKGFYSQQEISTDTKLEMYTSSGIGMTRYPFRFMNIPEIIEINFS